MSELSVREATARALFAWNAGRTPYFVITSEFGREVDADDPYQPITDAALAAVADHDGLAVVLAAHVQHEEQAIVDGHVWCASCDTQIGDWTRERGIEALDAMWTAHLVDVVRAWLRGTT